MKVAVRAFATLTACLPPSDVPGRANLELADGSTLGDVLRALAIPPGLPYLAVVNGREAPPDHVVGPGDVVTIFPPLVGG